MNDIQSIAREISSTAIRSVKQCRAFESAQVVGHDEDGTYQLSIAGESPHTKIANDAVMELGDEALVIRPYGNSQLVVGFARAPYVGGVNTSIDFPR